MQFSKKEAKTILNDLRQLRNEVEALKALKTIHKYDEELISPTDLKLTEQSMIDTIGAMAWALDQRIRFKRFEDIKK